MILTLQDGGTALHWASYNGHDEIVRVLLAAKATINIQHKVGFVVQTIYHNILFTLFSSYVQSGETPLCTASFYGHQKCMELLIDAGANVDVPKEVSSYIHIASIPGRLKYGLVLIAW